MKHILKLVVIILLHTNASAQTDILFEDKMDLKSEERSYSWAHKNLFLDYKCSFFTEYFLIPKVYYDKIGTSDENGNPYQKADGGLQFTIASATLEPRVNLWSGKKNAIFVKAPLSFGLSVTVELGKYTNFKSTGVFHYTAPILLGYGRGLNSSYSNCQESGFAISGGVQYMKSPMVGGTPHEWEIEDYSPEFVERNKWVQPLVQFDYYWLSKQSKVRGVSFTMNPAQLSYFKLAMCFTLTPK